MVPRPLAVAGPEAVATVTTAPAERRLAKPYQDPHEYDDVWVVEVEWTPIGEPLLVDEIPLEVRAGNAPFDKNGDGRQQYCIVLPVSSSLLAWLEQHRPDMVA